MADVRLIDATALQNTISEWRKKEMENDNSITGPAIIDAFGDVLDAISVAPTIDPETLRPVWRDPETDPPKVETEVLVLYRNDIDGYGITTAHYEDGSVFLQDSEWYWEDLPDWGTYDEERDDYKIPKGWWEYRHFNPDEVYNNEIDRPVIGWMPLPEKLKKEGVA